MAAVANPQMMLCNKTSRYHVAAAAIRGGAFHNPNVSINAHEMASYVMHLAQKDNDYIQTNGKGQIIQLLVDVFGCTLMTYCPDPNDTFDTPKFD